MRFKDLSNTSGAAIKKKKKKTKIINDEGKNEGDVVPYANMESLKGRTLIETKLA